MGKLISTSSFRRNAVREYLAVFWVNHAVRPDFCEAVPGLFTPVQRQDVFLPGYGMDHLDRFTITGNVSGKMSCSDGNEVCLEGQRYFLRGQNRCSVPVIAEPLKIPAVFPVAAISVHPFLRSFVIFKSIFAGRYIHHLNDIFRIPSQAAAHAE